MKKLNPLEVNLSGLLGSRETAIRTVEEFADKIDENTSVVVEMKDVQAVAQGFCDEFCKQVLNVYSAAELIFVDSDEFFQRRVNLTSTIRGNHDKIVFINN